MRSPSLLGAHVTLPDGTTGQVVAEYWSWENELGIHHGHRLRIRYEVPVCRDCPLASGTVIRFVTVDAGDVELSRGQTPR